MDRNKFPGKYRYDPQFLIQFRDVISYTIDPTSKLIWESLDIHPNATKRSVPLEMPHHVVVHQNKFTGGLPARFNGPGGKGGGQFDGGGIKFKEWVQKRRR